MREGGENGYWIDSKLAISASPGAYKVQWKLWRRMPEAGRKGFTEQVWNLS